MMLDEPLDRIRSNTDDLRDAFDDVRRASERFTNGLSTALDQVLFKGRRLGDVLREMALRMSSSAFHSGLKPLENSLSRAVGSLFGRILPPGRGAGLPVVQPFARGGVVNAPTLFQAGSDLGLMGEAGAEAILPLSRGGDGRLGVRAEGGSRPVTVNVTIHTPDVDGFNRARGQVAADLARAVDRGRRHL